MTYPKIHLNLPGINELRKLQTQPDFIIDYLALI